MAKWIGAICVWCAGSLAWANSAPSLSLLEVTPGSKEAYLRLFRLGLDIPAQRSDQTVTVVGTAAEKEWLEAQGYTVNYLIRDAERFFAARAEAAGATSMGGFRTLAQIWAAVDSMIALYPAVVSSKLLIGLSGEGRPLYAVRVSDNPELDEGEPAILFTALHHAREPISAHILLYTMQQLAAGWGSDPDITALVDGREIWFVPAVNPDGYAYNETIKPEGGGMWRKNRRNNGDGTFGVDPNRNYGFMWGLDNVGSSPNPGSETYRGPGPFSESEIQALRDFATARPNIRIAFNYHSYSNLLLYPWGYFRGYTPDQALFAALADSATAVNGYLPGPGWSLYLTNGDADDWMYGERGILAFTPEVGNSSDNFWPSPSRIMPLTLENHPANLFAIRYADTPERILPPGPPVWDSIALAATDSLGLYWHSNDSGINAPVQYEVRELFGSARIVDDFESGAGAWELKGFAISGARYFDGTRSLHSSTGNNLSTFARAAEPVRVDSTDTLRFWAFYDMETDWDYAYVELSTDGGLLFTPIPGNITRMTNPHGNNLGHGITGTSDGWVPAVFPLSPFAGEWVLLRLSYRTDAFVFGSGFYVDGFSHVQKYDSARSLVLVTQPPVVLGGYPPGTYHFRIVAADAQGQEAASFARTFGYGGGPSYMIGDVNESGSITSADIIYLVNYLFKSGPAPRPVWQAGDVNASGTITSADIIYLVNYVFKGGPPPLQP